MCSVEQSVHSQVRRKTRDNHHHDCYNNDDDSEIVDIKGTSAINSQLSKARRILKKDDTVEGKDKAMAFYNKAIEAYKEDKQWREKANTTLLADLNAYDQSINNTIGLRQQKRLTDDQAKGVASCLSVHRNVSLEF